MRIVATSDLHGDLPVIPECDLLLLGGDYFPLELDRSPNALGWLNGAFWEWLHSAPAKRTLGIAGNHDFFFEGSTFGGVSLPWIYLRDTLIEIDGLAIYGIPWVPRLPSWAFSCNDMRLREQYDAIPKGVDIVLAHGPPLRYLDNTEYTYGAWQANSMLDRVKPKLYICGHVHEGYGREMHGNEVTEIVNVSRCTLAYDPTNPVVIIDV